MAKVCQLFSGSGGNSIYISCKESKFLVDIGVSAKREELALKNIGVEPSKINAIFVTHEHTDHISGVRVFASRYNIPVYAHPDVLAYMKAHNKINEKVIVNPIDNEIELSETKIIPFLNSHDSVACFGYRFNLSDGRSVGICTDTGYVTDGAKKTLNGCDLVFLESNHEIEMLQIGPYTYDLKKRILSKRGHLSNRSCSEYACELVKNGTTRLVLAHVSAENNTPYNAYQTTLSKLTEAGYKENRDFRLSVSAVENKERPIVL